MLTLKDSMARIRIKSMPLYDKLVLTFGGDRANSMPSKGFD
jgi:hypothetical protein